MDANDRSLRDLVTMMELQIQGMARFQVTEMDAKEALKTKDWPRLEKALHSLDFQAEGLRCVEERRHDLWTGIQRAVLGREGRFLETIPQLPEEFREPLLRLHRDLKIQAVGLRGLTQGLTTYLQTAGALIQAVVQEIQPALKGRLYSRNGNLRKGDAQPLVLNTHF
jgi:hypothetical protein